MQVSDSTKRKVRKVGWLVVAATIVMTVLNATGVAGAAPTHHHHHFRASCTGDRKATWSIHEGILYLGTYSVLAHECTNHHGRIRSHHYQVVIDRSIFAKSANYEVKFDYNEVAFQGRWGEADYAHNHAQVCAGIGGFCVHGYEERFGSAVTFYAPRYLRRMARHGHPELHRIMFGPPGENPLGQKGYHLRFDRVHS